MRVRHAFQFTAAHLLMFRKMQGKNEAAPALTNERSNDRRSDAGGLMGLDPRVEVRVVA